MKSSLILKQNTSSSAQKNQKPQIQYKQINNHNDIIGELSDEEKELEFNRQHEQYIKMKVNRKKQLLKLKKQQFGTSSSESQESSEEQIAEANVKRSKGKQAIKSIKELKQNNSLHKQFKLQQKYKIILLLKKTKTQTDLIFHLKQFEINKKLIQYIKITKIGISQQENNIKIIIYMHGQEICLLIDQQNHQKDVIFDIFLQLARFKMALVDSKENYQNKKNSKMDEYSEEQQENAIIFDKIYKKSQFIGNWQQRYIILKPQGIYSYRTLKSNATMFIPMHQIKQIQTPFQFYKENLIIKLIYNSTKTDFGIPYNYNLIWLQSFAKIIKNKQKKG